LHFASKEGHAKAVLFLVKHGADVEALNDVRNERMQWCRPSRRLWLPFGGAR
jgi:hypothetical protein